jgi:hypothetical protein
VTESPGRRPAARRRRRVQEPAVTDDRGAATPAVVAPRSTTAPDDDDRSTTLRLARVHLRLGALSLARAELESLAGRGQLDEAALADLAEARWRTGDLAGAGEAARLLLEQGSSAPMGLVIAAEVVAAQGRPREARRLVARALDAIEGPLDAVFAGMPRNAPWPVEPMPPAADAAVAPVSPQGYAGWDGTAPASAAAAEAYTGGRAALATGSTGHVTRAALQLSVALRLDPGIAGAVLDAIGGRATEPELALVAGDALRLLGRETDALAAYEVARGGRAAPAADGGPAAAGGRRGLAIDHEGPGEDA